MIPLAVSEVITAITAVRNAKYVPNLGRRVKGSSANLALTMAGASLHKVSFLAPGHQELPRVARSRSIQTRAHSCSHAPQSLPDPPTPNHFTFPASHTLETKLIYRREWRLPERVVSTYNRKNRTKSQGLRPRVWLSSFPPFHQFTNSESKVCVIFIGGRAIYIYKACVG